MMIILYLIIYLIIYLLTDTLFLHLLVEFLLILEMFLCQSSLVCFCVI